ncbi:MAG: hypothetical protein UH543_00535 [Bacteroidales bacterium]|nr:hypothetical protein [Bacteroidales bacterium]
MLNLEQFLDWTIREMWGGEIYQVDEFDECIEYAKSDCACRRGECPYYECDCDFNDCECAYCTDSYSIVRLYGIDWEDIENGFEVEELDQQGLAFIKDFFKKHETLFLVQEEVYENDRFQYAETVREYFTDKEEAKAYCDKYFE